MPAACERCGSIRVARRQPSTLDRVVAVFTGKSPWMCRRCGWRGRTAWRDEDVVRLPEGRDDGGGDPSLAALDAEQGSGIRDQSFD